MKSKKNTKELEKLKPIIVKTLKKYGVKKAGIFGSYVRGEQKKDSDVDILIEPKEDTSLLDLSGLKIELEENLGKNVDLVSYKYIHPHLKKGILENEMRIL
jgi:predicted nucleotidyltransferase